jgi:hypothetical protein
LKHALPTIVIVLIVLAGSWSGILMFGIWQSVYNASEFVYHYGSGIGTMLLGCAAIYGIFDVFNRYKKARLEIRKSDEHRKLKFRLAEEAIDLFNQTHQDLIFVRRAFISISELKELGEKWSFEDADEVIREPKHDGFISLMRIEKVRSTVAKIEALRPKFAVIFGDDTIIKNMLKIWNGIRTSATTLTNMAPENPDRETHVKVVFSSETEPFSPTSTELVEHITSLCGPVLNE